LLAHLFFYTAVYNNEPCQGVPDDLCNAKILGGHGEMWGETVDTSDLAQTVWPRLAAIGTLAKIEINEKLVKLCVFYTSTTSTRYCNYR